MTGIEHNTVVIILAVDISNYVKSKYFFKN